MQSQYYFENFNAFYTKSEKKIMLNTFLPLLNDTKVGFVSGNFFLKPKIIPLIKKIAGFNKSIILSTGLSDLKLIDSSKKIIFNEWKKKSKKKKDLVLMHCVTSYPVDPKEANLNAIRTLQKNFKDCVIGYSDHTLGIQASCSAVAMGARIIEKHFT